VLAVDELATNAIRHGAGAGVLRVWGAPGELICQVEDGGRIEDALAGRRIPMIEQAKGFGLWLVNQLCELVEIRTGQTGTMIRAHARLD
jgi:anti-sigma regulatory factor (Ser/Thr protein kinase)